MLDPSLDVAPGTEPAYCPSCELRHTRRPDWLCPRCGMPVDAEVSGGAAARPSSRRAARRAEEEAEFPVGSRIAGGAMALCALALAAGLARQPLHAQRWPLVGAAVVLLVLGLGALLTIPWARWTAVGVGAVAALLLAEDLVRDRLPDLVRDPLPAAIRGALRDLVRPLYPTTIFFVLAFVAGGLLLLAGRPRRVRIVAGVLLAAPLVALHAIRMLGR